MAEQFRPDRGWAWAVLAAAFLANVVFDGVTFSFGVYYIEFMDHFRQGPGLTSWVGAFTPAMYAFVGPLASVLANRFGCRPVAAVGSLVATVGIIGSVFAPNIWVMMLTYGLMAGAGFGLMHLCSYVIVAYYFEKNRALATGVASCGSGIGTFIFAPLSAWLISMYAWKGALMIIAGIVLNGVVFAGIYRPVPHMEGPGEKDELGKTPKKKLLDFTLLKDPVFLVFGLSSFLCAIGFFVPFMVLPAQALKIGVLDLSQGAWLISIVGISNCVNRVVCGLVADRPWGDALKLYIGVLICGGLATACVPWMNSYVLLAVYAAIFGATIAAFIALAPPILVELLGVQRLSDSFGFLNLFRGIACFIGPPLTGYLNDVTGDFTIGLHVTGAVICAAGVICIPLRAIHYCQLAKDPHMDDMDEIEIEAVDSGSNANGKVKVSKMAELTFDVDEVAVLFH